MDMASWLIENILPSKCLDNCAKWHGEVILKDNTRVSVRVKNLPPSVIIVPEKIEKEEWRILKERKNAWDSRCDYILVGSDPLHGTFVFFVELKGSMLDHADSDYKKEQSEKGYIQLWWAKPMIKYLLSAFNTDNILMVDEGCLTIRYFLLGAEYVGTLRRRVNKQGVKGRLFHSEEYKSITVNMLETSGNMLPVRFDDMLHRSK